MYFYWFFLSLCFFFWTMRSTLLSARLLPYNYLRNILWPCDPKIVINKYSFFRDCRVVAQFSSSLITFLHYVSSHRLVLFSDLSIFLTYCASQYFDVSVTHRLVAEGCKIQENCSIWKCKENTTWLVRDGDWWRPGIVHLLQTFWLFINYILGFFYVCQMAIPN